MNIQELVNIFSSETNPLIVIALILYYVLINWGKLKDGLGLSKDNRTNLAKIEQNYNLLKLRIEIEQLKKNSGLDTDLLLTLEREMNDRLDNITHKSFSPLQKFLAIPLALLFIATAFLELQSPAAEMDAIETILGLSLILLIIYIGFWGLPLLQKQQPGWLKNFALIVFWSIAFYVIAYVFFFIVLQIMGSPQLLIEYQSVMFIISITCSVALSLFGKLPLSARTIT